MTNTTLMSKKLAGLTAVCAFILLSACASTPPKQTGMLKPEQGYTGDVIGAKVLSVKPAGERLQAVEVGLPDIGSVNSVRVTDAEGNTVTQGRDFEYINDTERGRNGVIIYLDKKHKVPFRLNFNDQPEQ